MSVRELPSGRWQARVMIEGRRHAATLDSRQQAEDWILITRARNVTGALPRRVTVHEYGARWIVGYDVGPASTRRFHEQNLRLYIYPTLGRRQFATVTPSEVTVILNRVREQVSAAKADSVYRTLSALAMAAAQDDIIDRSPVRSRKHRPRRQRSSMPVLERDQARAVLLQLGGWHRDVAVLQLSLGARFGEIAGLTPHDVHDSHVDIVRRVSGSGATAEVAATKNHRRRTLELPALAAKTAGRLAVEAQQPPPLPGLADREWPAGPWRKRWLVQTATGHVANLAKFNVQLRTAVATVGLPERNQVRSSHGLRHSYVSWMVDDGHGADKIGFWIGDTPETVRRVYAHMLEASSTPAAASIDAALGDLG